MLAQTQRTTVGHVLEVLIFASVVVALAAADFEWADGLVRVDAAAVGG